MKNGNCLSFILVNYIYSFYFGAVVFNNDTCLLVVNMRNPTRQIFLNKLQLIK